MFANVVVPQDVTSLVVQNYVLETDTLEVRDVYIPRCFKFGKKRNFSVGDKWKGHVIRDFSPTYFIWRFAMRICLRDCFGNFDGHATKRRRVWIILLFIPYKERNPLRDRPKNKLCDLFSLSNVGWGPPADLVKERRRTSTKYLP